MKFGLPLIPPQPGSRELHECLQSHGLEKIWPEVKDAYYFAKGAHQGQKRDDGTPYYHHPNRVAINMIARLGVTDKDAIKGALLHDVAEDTGVTLKDIEKRFGPKVARYVDLLSKPDPKPGQSYPERNEEYLERLEGSGSEQAVAIKLADRLDNIEDTHLMPNMKKVARYLADTSDHYVPLAQRHFPAIAKELAGRVGVIGNWMHSL